MIDSDGSGLDHSASFTYDGAGRLTGATIGGGPSQHRFVYAYDGLQNMIRREAHGPTALGMLTGDYLYAEPDEGGARGPRQLTSVVPDPLAGSPPGAGTILFDYDPAGRMTRQGDLELDYDGFDQLVRVQGLSGPGSPGTVEHAHDHDGQRLSTRDPGGLVQTWFSSDIMERADGARDHHVRPGDRLIARITMEPAASSASGPASGAVFARGAVAIAKALLAAVGLLFVFAVLAAPRSRRARRHAAVSAATAVALLLSSCGETTSSRRTALSVTRQVLYYHQGTLLNRAGELVQEVRNRYGAGGEYEGGRAVHADGTVDED